MSKSLTVMGRSLAIAPGVVANGALVSARIFLAGKFGVVIPPHVKGEKGLSTKEVKALALAAGTTEEQWKAGNKEYDAGRIGFFSASGLINGQLAADPTLRKQLRVRTQKNGEQVAVCTYRKEKVASLSQANVIAQLTAKLARFEAMEAQLLTAPAATA